MKLTGKSTVITGAATGIGRATAFLFAREGATVMCVDIDLALVQETVDMIRQAGGSAEFIQTDLADPAQIERMARQCLDWRDRIDVLFNNAGILVRAGFESTRLDDWNRHIAVNLTAPYLCSQLLLPALKASGSASIIHNGSIDAVLGNPTIVAYSAS